MGGGNGEAFMARDSQTDAALALHRFGFGARAGSIAAIVSDPQGALIAELERPQAGALADPDLLSSGEAARATFNFTRERRAARLAERAQREAKKQTQTSAPQTSAPKEKPAAPANQMAANNECGIVARRR